MSSGDTILDKALAKLAQQEAEVIKTKTLINQMRELVGEPPMFPDVGEVSIAANGSQSAPVTVRMDQFFNKPLATCVREVLDLRKKHGLGPATADEIHAVLVRGGFNFPSREEREQKRGLMVSLAKNTVTFRKLPNDTFGLAEWYGNSPKVRVRFANKDGTTASRAALTPDSLVEGDGEEAAAATAAPEVTDATEGK